MSLTCSRCNKRSYGELCFRCKPHKRIPQKGKRAIEYEQWRDTVAKPYLDKKYGHVCNHGGCYETQDLDVDHKRNRGSHPELKMQLTNMQYLCRTHHSMKTDRLENE